MRRPFVPLALVLLGIAAVVAPSCKNKDKNPPPPAATKLRIDTAVGDTSIDFTRYVCLSSFEGQGKDYTLDQIDVVLDGTLIASGSTPPNVTLDVEDAAGNIQAQDTQTSPTNLTTVDFTPRDPNSHDPWTVPLGQTFYIRLFCPTSGPLWVLNRNGTRAFLDGTAIIDGVVQSNSATNSPHEEFSYKLYSVESF